MSKFTESDLVWQPWKKHSSKTLKPNEIAEYMRNLFSKKLESSPKSIGWAFYGTSGVESAYVRNTSLKINQKLTLN